MLKSVSREIARRPKPPNIVCEVDYDSRCGTFLPAPEMEKWLRGTFIERRGLLFNRQHEHLLEAHIGCLWTNVPLTIGMLPVVGTAEAPMCQGNKWKKGRQEYQIEQWFGKMPDFIITFYAPYVNDCSDINFCAVGEHELCHCAQVRDGFNEPMFKRDGRPKFGIRGHDVEEHVTIVERYGAAAGAGATMELVKAANKPPLIGIADIRGACGNCVKKAA